jgi:hypothetical protein
MLPEARPSYPGHRQLVFSNEMKFRELMSDCQSIYSNELIRCYVDQSGGMHIYIYIYIFVHIYIYFCFCM